MKSLHKVFCNGKHFGNQLAKTPQRACFLWGKKAGIPWQHLTAVDACSSDERIEAARLASEGKSHDRVLKSPGASMYKEVVFMFGRWEPVHLDPQHYELWVYGDNGMPYLIPDGTRSYWLYWLPWKSGFGFYGNLKMYRLIKQPSNNSN